MLNADLKQQLQQLLQLMEGDVEFRASTGSDDKSKELKDLLDEIVEMTDHITIVEKGLRRTPSFQVSKPEGDTGIIFAGIPLSHEFNSFMLAILQVSGRAPKEKQAIIDQTRSLEGNYNFEAYVSLTCQKCPDVIQALNLMSVINPNITHTMIDGTVFREESKDTMAVSAVFLDGEEFSNGRIVIPDILSKLGSTQDASEYEDKSLYDVLIISGGPASGSAAIYTARKGLHTGIVADRIGGQVNDTAGIENFIIVKQTTGSEFSSSLAVHIKEYNIDNMTSICATKIEKTDRTIRVTSESDAVLESRTAIISMGTGWRKLNIPDEDRLINKGVAFCPHCDGPLLENKDVAVIGGGNPGVEAAISLAGIVKHVTLFEFAPELKMDTVLRERLRSLPNVDIHINARTAEVLGEDHVASLSYEDISSGEMRELNLDGIFVQIGLVPNTKWIGDAIELNSRGEVVVDRENSTNVPGIFAASDVTDQKYKQIIISMGSGVNAALSAFGYIIRN